MSGMIQVNVGLGQETASALIALKDSIDEIVRDLNTRCDELTGGPFQGAAQQGLATAWGSCEAGLRTVANDAAAMSSRLSAFVERVLAADGGGASAINPTTAALGGYGPAMSLPGHLSGASLPNGAERTLGAAAGATAVSGGGGSSSDGWMNFSTFGGTSPTGFAYGIDGSIYETSVAGSTTIAGIPMSGSASFSIGDTQAGVVFDPLNGNAYAAASASALEASAQGSIGVDGMSATGTAQARVGGVDAFAGMKDGQFGASIGATAFSVDGEVKAEVAGMDVGVGVEAGLKAELGFSTDGDSYTVDLPIFSVTVDPPEFDDPGAIITSVGELVGGDVGSAIGDVGGVVSDPLGAVGDLIGGDMGDLIGDVGEVISNPVSVVDDLVDAGGDVIEGIGDLFGF